MDVRIEPDLDPVKAATGTVVGYARVSSSSQSLEVQLQQLAAAGATKVFQEKKSAVRGPRSELDAMLGWVREGDIVVVCRLDRLARSITDMWKIMDALESKKVAFHCIQQPFLNTSTSGGRLMFSILGAFAQFEADIRKDRQMEGIARAKAEGKTGGRPLRYDPALLKTLVRQGKTFNEIVALTGISRRRLYFRAAEIGLETGGVADLPAPFRVGVEKRLGL